MILRKTINLFQSGLLCSPVVNVHKPLKFGLLTMSRRRPEDLHAEYDGGRAVRQRRAPPFGERRRLEVLPQFSFLQFGEEIGHGNFSHVYRGTYHGNQSVAIKVIERGSDTLIDNEIELLRELQGCPHVVQLYEVLSIENEASNQETRILVFEMIETADREDLFDEISLGQLQTVLRMLLEALRAAHARGIVHRDVKLGNILISPTYDNAVLIDWGCGCFISDSMSAKAGSRSCRPPEMLMGYRNYGWAGDMWAFGVLILFFLSDGFIPWKARVTPKAIARMSQYFGGDRMWALAARLGLPVPDTQGEQISRSPVRKIESAFSDDLKDLRHPLLVDLMMKCMELDPVNRLSADEALRHPFFKEKLV